MLRAFLNISNHIVSNAGYHPNIENSVKAYEHRNETQANLRVLKQFSLKATEDDVGYV